MDVNVMLNGSPLDDFRVVVGCWCCCDFDLL